MKERTQEQKDHSEKRWHEIKKESLLQMIGKTNKRLELVLRKIYDSNKERELILPLFESTYLFGTVGSGKTVRAAVLMLEWSRLQAVNGKSKQNCLFISVPMFLNKLKASFHSPLDDEYEIMKKYKIVDMLVLDDLGVQKATDWSFQEIYSLISYRYDNMLPTIFTSNLSLSELAEGLGDDRIPSRIEHMCGENIIEFTRKSMRK